MSETRIDDPLPELRDHVDKLAKLPDEPKPRIDGEAIGRALDAIVALRAELAKLEKEGA